MYLTKTVAFFALTAFPVLLDAASETRSKIKLGDHQIHECGSPINKQLEQACQRICVLGDTIWRYRMKEPAKNEAINVYPTLQSQGKVLQSFNNKLFGRKKAGSPKLELWALRQTQVFFKNEDEDEAEKRIEDIFNSIHGYLDFRKERIEYCLKQVEEHKLNEANKDKYQKWLNGLNPAVRNSYMKYRKDHFTDYQKEIGNGRWIAVVCPQKYCITFYVFIGPAVETIMESEELQGAIFYAKYGDQFAHPFFKNLKTISKTKDERYLLAGDKNTKLGM